jgi:hypothetical protein
MRRNSGDETRRELERAAQAGDKHAALKLLYELKRTGDLPTGPLEVHDELQSDTLGRVELSVVFPEPDGVARDVTFTVLFHDIRRGRARGVAFEGNLGPVDQLALSLALYKDLGRGGQLQGAVGISRSGKPTTRPIDQAAIIWPPQLLSSIEGRTLRTFELIHYATWAVMENFWANERFRTTLLETLMKIRLANKIATIERLRREFTKAETDAADVIEEDLSFKAGTQSYYPPVEEGSEEDEAAGSREYAEEAARAGVRGRGDEPVARRISAPRGGEGICAVCGEGIIEEDGAWVHTEVGTEEASDHPARPE